MAKTSFTKGFADARLKENRQPMAGKIDTGDTVIEFETSFPHKRAWNVYKFIALLSKENVSPEEAFENSFGSGSIQPKIANKK